MSSIIKQSFLLFLLNAGAAFSAMAAEPTQEEIMMQNQYVEYRLEQGEIYKIYVKMTDGVTTIQFPSAITEIAGKNISADGKGCDFQIAVKPGSYYFNVTAMASGATGTLTVTFNRQLYILYLVQSDQKAYASVVFSKNSGQSHFSNNVVTSTPKVTPARLVSLIDIAKKYEVLKETYPETISGVEQVKFKNRYRCGKYDIYLDEAIRFEEEDTVIFKLRLDNLTSDEIKYDKHSFSAHAGNSVYYMSVSDASGIMPPKSQTYAWFGITSTPHGGRNNLTADNDWLIALTTQEMHLNNLQSLPKEKKASPQPALSKPQAESIASIKAMCLQTRKHVDELRKRTEAKLQNTKGRTDHDRN